MIVIMLSDCPPKVRGDLSKWLCEINTGVFVGNVSSRVREEVWQRICENIKSGQATMVFSAPGEQKMDFRVHNTTWEPVDLDGIKLMRRPLPAARKSDGAEKEEQRHQGATSRAEQLYMAERMAKARAKKQFQEGYVVLDIETTGTSLEKDEIIEIGALKVESGAVTEEFSMLIRINGEIPVEIQKLTGITEQELQSMGRPLEEVLEKLFEFAENRIIVGHNVAFDYNFIRAACRKMKLEMRLGTASRDTLALSRRKIKGVGSYQLEVLMKHLGYEVSNTHRALADCYFTWQLYQKLNEM